MSWKVKSKREFNTIKRCSCSSRIILLELSQEWPCFLPTPKQLSKLWFSISLNSESAGPSQQWGDLAHWLRNSPVPSLLITSLYRACINSLSHRDKPLHLGTWKAPIMFLGAKSQVRRNRLSSDCYLEIAQWDTRLLRNCLKLIAHFYSPLQREVVIPVVG